MSAPIRAERLTIYVEQTLHRGRVPAFVEIVERARAAGLAGATVVQGVEGFGGSARIHRGHPLSVRADVPMVVTIVDTPEQIERFVPEIEKLVSRGLIVRQPVEVVVHRWGRASGEAAGS